MPHRGSAIDTASLGFGLVTYAMPEFWPGMLLILIFAVALGWFPTSFMSTPGMVDASAGTQLVDTMEHLPLPALTLVLALLGEYALIMRSSVTEAMNVDYVTTARAKGMREALVPHSGEAGTDEPLCLGEVPELQDLAQDHRVGCRVAARRARK